MSSSLKHYLESLREGHRHGHTLANCSHWATSNGARGGELLEGWAASSGTSAQDVLHPKTCALTSQVRAGSQSGAAPARYWRMLLHMCMLRPGHTTVPDCTRRSCPYDASGSCAGHSADPLAARLSTLVLHLPCSRSCQPQSTCCHPAVSNASHGCSACCVACNSLSTHHGRSAPAAAPASATSASPASACMQACDDVVCTWSLWCLALST